ETPEGWLLLTHGVGPMRTYAIGAMLLDLDDPTKIRGRLPAPLLQAAPAEREGYVPNVVYTCGSMIHGGTLYIPFALADRSTTLCAVAVKDLVQRLLASAP
ncbi:MAG: glycosidase, partial [Phycisphaerae bacterium]|nr:glycosidase [Phycisphaerae bacterium]